MCASVHIYINVHSMYIYVCSYVHMNETGKEMKRLRRNNKVLSSSFLKKLKQSLRKMNSL